MEFFIFKITHFFIYEQNDLIFTALEASPIYFITYLSDYYVDLLICGRW